MRATVVKRVSFEAAHFLPNYDGPCRNTHGHHFVVEIGVSGEVDKETGMVIDFKHLKQALEPIIDKFDHHLLNDTIPNPTAENIASYIFDLLQGGLAADWSPDSQDYSIVVEFVRVWETEDSYAEVRGD